MYKSLTLVLGSPKYTLDLMAYNAELTKRNKVRIFLDENFVKTMSSDDLLYYKKDKNDNYFYHANANAMLHSYESLYESVFFSNTLNRYIYSIYLEDLNWDKTEEKFVELNLKFTLVYRIDKNVWMLRTPNRMVNDPPTVVCEADFNTLREVITYDNLNIIHMIAFYDVSWL